MATKSLQITGKCVSKKNKRMFVFTGKDPVKVKGGWKLEKQGIHEVFNKNVYAQMKRGESIFE